MLTNIGFFRSFDAQKTVGERASNLSRTGNGIPGPLFRRFCRVPRNLGISSHWGCLTNDPREKNKMSRKFCARDYETAKPTVCHISKPVFPPRLPVTLEKEACKSRSSNGMIPSKVKTRLRHIGTNRFICFKNGKVRTMVSLNSSSQVCQSCSNSRLLPVPRFDGKSLI